MNSHELINHFYSSFAKGDAEAMNSCYAQDVSFTDPAFGQLNGDRARGMWSMLIARNKGEMKLEYKILSANETHAEANWIATYVFKPTGRKVINNIHANFELKDGKIVKHVDQFDLHKWAKQAMGFKGILLGGTQTFKKKLNATVNGYLDTYLQSKHV